jgi:hypothetical protein
MDDNCAGDYYLMDKALGKRTEEVTSEYMV